MAMFILAILRILWPLVLVPLVLLLIIRPVGRLVFFILGVAFFVGTALTIDLSGADSPAFIIPCCGLCLSLAAILAELLSRAVRLVRRHRLADAPPD